MNLKENSNIKILLTSSAIPQELRKQLLDEFQELKKYTALLEMELGKKQEELFMLYKTVTLHNKNKLHQQKLSICNELEENNKNRDLKIGKINSDDILIQEEKNQFPDHWKKFNFLLIEDNNADITLLKGIFKIWGLKLDIAITLKEAKQKMKQKYNCIISDVVLPDGDGLGNILNLRFDDEAVNQNTPAIIITTNANKSGAKIAQRAKIQCYFNKPFSLKNLRNGLLQIFDPNQFNSKLTTNVILDAKETWSWFDILNYKFNSRYQLMTEFMEIFLNQSKSFITLINQPINEQNKEIIQFELFKLRSTVNIVGLKDLCDVLSKIQQDLMEGCNDNLYLLFDHCKTQLQKDIERVEQQIF